MADDMTTDRAAQIADIAESLGPLWETEAVDFIHRYSVRDRDVRWLLSQLSTADAERREMVGLIREAADCAWANGEQTLAGKLRQAADRADGGRG